MAYEEREKARAAQMPHSLRLDERERLAVSGVEEVVSFDEGEVCARTVKGLLFVRGSALKVDKLEKSAGEMTVSGVVTELRYEETGSAAGFWARLFH